MKTILLAMAILSLFPAVADAQAWAKAKLERSPRHLEWVTLKHGNREVACYIGYPEIKEKATVVVVIHDVWGMSEWARGVVDDFAAAGYIAVAPDLLWGSGPKGGGTSEFSNDEIPLAMRALPGERVTGDLNAAVEYASKLPAGNGKVVVAGFCWGGSEAFRFATNNPTLRAALVFYGDAPDDAAALVRITCPVLGFYAENDARINATIDRTTAQMKAAGKTYEPVFYAGSGHGFMKAGEAPAPGADEEQNVRDRYESNRQARKDAWRRVLVFLRTL